MYLVLLNVMHNLGSIKTHGREPESKAIGTPAYFGVRWSCAQTLMHVYLPGIACLGLGWLGTRLFLALVD